MNEAKKKIEKNTQNINKQRNKSRNYFNFFLFPTNESLETQILKTLFDGLVKVKGGSSLSVSVSVSISAIEWKYSSISKFFFFLLPFQWSQLANYSNFVSITLSELFFKFDWTVHLHSE